MYGSEIIIKITDFEDDNGEIQEIINWIQQMIDKKRPKHELVELPEPKEPKVVKEIKNVSSVGCITCKCGSSFDSKNINRHSKTLKHIEFMKKNCVL
jgi:hypothetical protein